jgi:AhpD family alkylhydroperoxidase
MDSAKRTLTPGNVFTTVGNVVASTPVLLAALVRPSTSAALREKVVLGVTAINDCSYCKWGHTHWAMANGVPLEEVNQILGLQIDALEAKNPAEAAAILFAQHYAESLDRLDPDSLENLRTFYSDAQAAEILAYVRAITLGSLTGNTVDAFLDRFRGRGREDSRGLIVVFEGVVTLVAAPVVLVLALLAKFDRRDSARHE